ELALTHNYVSTRVAPVRVLITESSDCRYVASCNYRKRLVAACSSDTLPPAMSTPTKGPADSGKVNLYDNAYGNYAAEVYRQVRLETYGEDFGQTSWVTTAESSEIPELLKVRPDSH